MARQSRSHVKSMLIIFFDCEGVVHYEFAPRGQTINNSVLCAWAHNEGYYATSGNARRRRS